jgi:hypothetical protein
MRKPIRTGDLNIPAAVLKQLLGFLDSSGSVIAAE